MHYSTPAIQGVHLENQNKRWPSAYASGWLVKEYKRRGGKYSGEKSVKVGQIHLRLHQTDFSEKDCWWLNNLMNSWLTENSFDLQVYQFNSWRCSGLNVRKLPAQGLRSVPLQLFQRQSIVICQHIVLNPARDSEKFCDPVNNSVRCDSGSFLRWPRKAGRRHSVPGKCAPWKTGSSRTAAGSCRALLPLWWYQPDQPAMSRSH